MNEQDTLYNNISEKIQFSNFMIVFQMVNVSDIGLLAQYVMTTSDQLHQQLKLIKRRIPPDMNISNLGINKEVAENLYQCYQHSCKIIKTLHDIVKTAIQFISACGGKTFL